MKGIWFQVPFSSHTSQLFPPQACATYTSAALAASFIRHLRANEPTRSTYCEAFDKPRLQWNDADIPLSMRCSDSLQVARGGDEAFRMHELHVRAFRPSRRLLIGFNSSSEGGAVYKVGRADGDVKAKKLDGKISSMHAAVRGCENCSTRDAVDTSFQSAYVLV